VAIYRSAGDNRWLATASPCSPGAHRGQRRPAEARALLEETRLAWSRTETIYGQPFDAYLRY
jgi:hypothetical protein